MSVQSFIETDWDTIVRTAALEKYKSFAVNEKVELDDLKFLKYTDLAKAVSKMVVKDDTLICKSDCSELIKTQWEEEKKLIERLGTAGVSVVKTILESLVKAAEFKDKKGQPIVHLERTNLLSKDLSPSYFYKKAILSGGGTKKLHWRPGLTRRVRQGR